MGKVCLSRGPVGVTRQLASHTDDTNPAGQALSPSWSHQVSFTRDNRRAEHSHVVQDKQTDNKARLQSGQ